MSVQISKCKKINNLNMQVNNIRFNINVVFFLARPMTSLQHVLHVLWS